MNEHDEGDVAGPGLMASTAARVGLTEGQLYSAVFVVLVVLLLSLTGLPTAERRPDTGVAGGTETLPTLQTTEPEAVP